MAASFVGKDQNGNLVTIYKTERVRSDGTRQYVTGWAYTTPEGFHARPIAKGQLEIAETGQIVTFDDVNAP